MSGTCTTFSEALLAGADFLEANPDKWTRGTYARDEVGQSIGPLHPDACTFCALGAARRACGITHYDLVELQPPGDTRFGDVFLFNDNHAETVFDVIRFMREAAGS